jgi:hypothetical protein
MSMNKESSQLLTASTQRNVYDNNENGQNHSVVDVAGDSPRESFEHARERMFDEKNGLSKPKKVIDSFGSFALVSNNISGPAMMGLPHLFHVAGILPVVFSIVLVFIGSSLTGTLLAEV